MKESVLEAYCIQQANMRYGTTRKVVFQGRTGAPDRWIFLPGGKLIIMELKQPGKKPRPDQQAEINILIELGFSVHVVTSKGQIDEILRDLA
jgi:hypothetical protein